MLPNPKTRNAPTGQGRGAESQSNVHRFHRTSIVELPRVLRFIIDTAALVECGAALLTQGERLSSAGRHVLLQRALRLHEIREEIGA